jgi:hypothetical protein
MRKYLVKITGDAKRHFLVEITGTQNAKDGVVKDIEAWCRHHYNTLPEDGPSIPNRPKRSEQTLSVMSKKRKIPRNNSHKSLH